MRVDIAQNRWLRSRTRILGIGSVWLLYTAFFVWMAFHHTERTAGGESASPGLTIMLLVFAVPGLILGIRELRSGLWIASDAVIVRGMFRTTTLSPNEIDGFKAEMRLAPSPVLHRKHGPPLIIGALAHGGFSKKAQADCVKTLEPICDQLNALLQAVQLEQPSRTPDALGIRPSDRRASYETAKRLSVAIDVCVVGVCVVIAVLLHTPAAIGLVSVIGLAEMARTSLTLRSARRKLDD